MKLPALLICSTVIGAWVAVTWADSPGKPSAKEVRSADPTEPGKDEQKSPKSASSPALDAMKKLVGEWTATGPDGKPMVTKFKLTAGGSVLHETLFADTPHEMVTVYHMDGPDLILTHYCMLGNQPKLKADSAKETKKISFRSVGGTNMKLTDPHMGMATYTLTDNDHFEADWCSCNNGKPDESHRFKVAFTRKK